MELNLPNGPWKTIASAKWNDHPLSIYLNAKHELLMVVFDKSGGKKGSLLLMKKAFLIETGELDKFVDSNKHDLTFLTRLSDGTKTRFLLVDVTPKYVTYNQQELMKAVKEQHMELDALTKITQDLARSCNVKISELNKDNADFLLGDPFSLFTLSQQNASGNQQSQSVFQQVRVLFGLQKNGELADSSLASLAKTVVLGESDQKQLQTLQLVCENALLNGIPCLIFDSNDSFGGLAMPNGSTADFEKFRMPPHPTGFPFKAYTAGEVVNADLSALDPNTIIKMLSAPNSEILIQENWKGMKTAEDLANAIEKKADGQTTIEKNRYFAFKTVRALRSLHKQLGGAFGENELVEIRSPWSGGTGKVVLIDCMRAQSELRDLVQQTILSQLKEPMRSQLSLMVVFDQTASELSSEVKKTLEKLSEKNIGFALRANSEQDLKPMQKMTLQLELIKEECISTEGNEKKRFALRPTFSQFRIKIEQPLPTKK
ncbi:MAG: hypothetical protein V1811_00645 [Candidatus Micrarchaeota archaeon]